MREPQQTIRIVAKIPSRASVMLSCEFSSPKSRLSRTCLVKIVNNFPSPFSRTEREKLARKQCSHSRASRDPCHREGKILTDPTVFPFWCAIARAGYGVVLFDEFRQDLGSGFRLLACLLVITNGPPVGNGFRSVSFVLLQGKEVFRLTREILSEEFKGARAILAWELMYS